jgi:hypothetical protein
MSAGSCPTCGAAVTAEQKFCPQCGMRLPDTDGTAVLDTPPHETSAAPVELLHADARFYGVTPPIAVLVLAVAAVAVAVLLLAQGSEVPGLVVLVIAVLLFVGFVVLAKRETVRNARERAGSVLESLAVRSGARRELVRLHHERERLAADRERALTALGRAVWDDDAAGREAAEAELRRLTDAVSAKEGEMQAITEAAQAHIERSRLQADTTSVIEPPQPGPEPGGPGPMPEPYPPPDEGDPPMPAPVPEPYPPPDEGDPPQPR